MFRFDSIANDLPNNKVDTNIDFTKSDNNNNNKIPIIHIENLTINITPSEIKKCVQKLVEPTKKLDPLSTVGRLVYGWYEDDFKHDDYAFCDEPVEDNSPTLIKHKPLRLKLERYDNNI